MSCGVEREELQERVETKRTAGSGSSRMVATEFGQKRAYGKPQSGSWWTVGQQEVMSAFVCSPLTFVADSVLTGKTCSSDISTVISRL